MAKSKMNIIELAKKACAPNQTFNSDPEWLERFAFLIRAEVYKNWNPDVTFNEDGTFSLELPDGDELRIIPPEREWVDLTDDDVAKVKGLYGQASFETIALAIIAAFKEKQK